MWRAWVAVVIAFVALAPSRAFAVVGCANNFAEVNFIESGGTPAAGWSFRNVYDVRTVGPGLEETQHFTYIGTWVAVGVACPAGKPYVFMPVADYEYMRGLAEQGANVVTETTFNAAVTSFTALITEANQYLIMGWILGLLIAGFSFGWRVVQRGSSQ